MQIAASLATVWALLIDAPSWPKWNHQIEKVAASSQLASGTRFAWTTAGTTMHSQVQLLDPEHRVAWTGNRIHGQGYPRLGTEPGSSSCPVGRRLVNNSDRRSPPLELPMPTYSCSSWRAITSRWISLVPSPIVHSFTSR
jgi:hypothetical protein